MTSGLSTAEALAFRTARWALLLTALVAVVGEIVGPLGVGQAPHTFALTTIVFEPMVTSGFLGAVFLYLLVEPRRRELAAVLAVAMVLEWLLDSYRAPVRPPYSRFLMLGVGVGLASMLGLAARAVLSAGNERQRAVGYLMLALVTPSVKVIGGFLQVLVVQQNPLVYDQFGYAIDGSLGFQPAMVVSAWLRSNPVLYYLCYTTYSHLSLLLVLGAVCWLRRPGSLYFNPLATYLVMGVVGTYLYDVYPMVGLEVALGERFPFGPAPILRGEPHLVEAPYLAPRNCMPSLHAGWIIAFYWTVRGAGGWWRRLGVFGLVATLLAVLMVGHYLIDAIVSYPFTLAAVALCASRRNPRRLAAMAVGVGLTALSLWALLSVPLFLAAHGALTWLACAAIVLASVKAEHWLAAGRSGALLAAAPMPGLSDAGLLRSRQEDGRQASDMCGPKGV